VTWDCRGLAARTTSGKAALPAPRLQREAGWGSLETVQSDVDAAAEEDESPIASYMGIAPPGASGDENRAPDCQEEVL